MCHYSVINYGHRQIQYRLVLHYRVQLPGLCFVYNQWTAKPFGIS